MTWKQSLQQSSKMFLRTGILTGISSALTIVLAGLNTQTGEIHINSALAVIMFLSTCIGALIMAINTFLAKWDGVETSGLLPTK